MAVSSGLEEEEDLSGVTASWRSPFAAPEADSLVEDALAADALAARS
jgi:hypothetical protein